MLGRLRLANLTRQKAWPGSEECDLSFRAIEIGGEVGELLNKIKKVLRMQRGIKGNRSGEESKLLNDIIEELGDVVISADLVAIALDIDLESAVKDKFNKTSEEKGINVYIE